MKRQHFYLILLLFGNIFNLKGQNAPLENSDDFHEFVNEASIAFEGKTLLYSYHRSSQNQPIEAVLKSIDLATNEYRELTIPILDDSTFIFSTYHIENDTIFALLQKEKDAFDSIKTLEIYTLDRDLNILAINPINFDDTNVSALTLLKNNDKFYIKSRAYTTPPNGTGLMISSAYYALDKNFSIVKDTIIPQEFFPSRLYLINDSSFLYQIENTIQFIDTNFNNEKIITYTDSIVNTQDLVSAYRDDKLFFNSIEKYANEDNYKVYMYDTEIDTTIILYEKSHSKGYLYNSFYKGIDLISDKYIYAGVNLNAPCHDSGIYFNCPTSFEINSISKDDGLRWSREIDGGFGFLLTHVIATPDSGCLALFHHDFDANSLSNGGMFYVKFDKLGTIDSTYLADLSEWTSLHFLVDDTDIKLYPNPVNDILYLEYDADFSNLLIEIYNVNGQMVLKELIENQKLDISSLSSGSYLYKIKNKTGKFKTGKIIRQ